MQIILIKGKEEHQSEMDGGDGEVKDKWIFGNAILLTLKMKGKLQGKECK